MVDRKSIAPRLADIIEAIERVTYTLQGLSLDSFEADWEKRWLVERGLEVLSEASRHLTDDLKSRHTDIPWAKVAGIGNVLRHEYSRVAADVLWKLARDDLPVLETVCRDELISRSRLNDRRSSEGASIQWRSSSASANNAAQFL